MNKALSGLTLVEFPTIIVVLESELSNYQIEAEIPQLGEDRTSTEEVQESIAEVAKPFKEVESID